MKKPRLSHLLLSLMFMLLCLLCFMCASPFFREDTTERRCTPLPERFSNADLVGTWVAESLTQGITDTLYIRADGTYKQVIHMGRPQLDYEGDWEHWWFEPRPNGTGYLHTQGMRECAAIPENPCEWINDGSVPHADACESKWMDPDPVGETVLVVNGYPFLDQNEKVSHPFSLTLFLGFESSPWDYIFKEP
jgi:hypothetical protein